MAFGNSTFSGAAGAVGDILGGYASAAGFRLKAQGDLAEASNYDKASALALDNEKFAEASTAIKTAQQQRQIYLGLGTEQADIAGAGLANSGTALDLLRSGAAQGALTQQVLGAQGRITEEGFDEQSKAYHTMAGAAYEASAAEGAMASRAITNGWITGATRGVAAMATLFT